MSKQVDRWIAKGRKNCANGHHWLILHFPDYQVCPLCGYKAKYDGMPEFNGFIVSERWNQNSQNFELPADAEFVDDFYVAD